MTGNEIYAKAKDIFVGGGCAGQRINRVLGRPLYIKSAKGARFIDADGEEWIDLHCGAGAQMFGFKNPQIEEAIQENIKNGFYMNFDSEKTLEFGERMKALIPTVEKLRFVNSGTEATMAAIRVARAFTGKNLIVKFDAHFHGMHEQIWYHGGYGSAYDDNGECINKYNASAGFPANSGDNVKLIRFNDIDAIKNVFDKYRGQIAALIVEPVNFDCGVVVPEKDYMTQMRELCTKEGILLIYDEVISGLRFRPGSAQGYYNVKPDLSTFAKAIANGFPLAAVAGKAEIMDMFNPLGPVVCSGTSSGNMMAVVAGCECLKMASEPDFYDRMDHIEDKLCGGMNDLLKKHGIPGNVSSFGARFNYWTGVVNPADNIDLEKAMPQYRDDLQLKLVEEMYKEHLFMLYVPDFPHHGGFCMAHTDEDIEEILDRLDRVCKNVATIV